MVTSSLQQSVGGKDRQSRQLGPTMTKGQYSWREATTACSCNGLDFLELHDVHQCRFVVNRNTGFE